MSVGAVVWTYTLEYVRQVSVKFANDQLYVMFGPVFDYDADGLADTNITGAARFNRLYLTQ